MIRKFFPLDKNYVLEEAQLSLQQSLLFELVEKVKIQYALRHNPLEIVDEFFRKIKEYEPDNLQPLDSFYRTLAGIYRYKFGDNQLELLWGGGSHFEKYQQDWVGIFDQWTTQFCEREQFIQAVLDLTVFRPAADQITHLAETRMNFVMFDSFALKIDKSKGVLVRKMA